ncbi:MAG: hypothetical protein ACTHYF_06860 [Ruoffia tabacinasalis]
METPVGKLIVNDDSQTLYQSGDQVTLYLTPEKLILV